MKVVLATLETLGIASVVGAQFLLKLAGSNGLGTMILGVFFRVFRD
jgi:hypothetical protein